MTGTTPGFRERLLTTARTKSSWVCVGLDPAPDKFPPHIRALPDAVLQFNRAIIQHTAPYAAAFKINFAFYEALGTGGLAILRDTIAEVPSDSLIIADAKRGDIANTARQYATGILDVLQADAVTVNPYLGLDSIEPFLGFPGKGVFVLCLTSNPGSRDFQYLETGGRPLYQVVLQKLVDALPLDSFGIVAGATHPDELAGLRAIAPVTPFLIPGIGAQGGDLEKAVRLGGNPAGELALINSSRNILYASQGEDFAEAAAREAKRLRDEINAIRKTLK